MKNLIKLLLVVSLTFGLAPYTFAQSADTILPSDVENLKVKEAGDSEITLTWDLATDDTGVTNYHIYYGTQSVTGEDPKVNYTKVSETEDVLEHTITDLKNGTTYYFAMTALDATGNESEYYSNEVNAAPEIQEVEEGDTEAPEVVSAEAVFDTEVYVEFSEPVIIPKSNPEDAFAIQSNKTLDYLEVLDAKLDKSGNVVVLTTAVQSAEMPYIVTVGIDVEDLAGNPIVSGVSDVAMFRGTDLSKEIPEPKEEPVVKSDTEGPFVMGIEVFSDTELKVTFNEKVNLGIDIVNNFKIALESDPEQKLTITSIQLEDDGYTVAIKTEKQSKVTYALAITGVSDKAGNIIDTKDEANVETFQGKGETTLLDLVAPENVTGLVSKAVNGVVNLSWSASIDSENDLTGLILYKSKDKGKTYDNGTQISPDATTYTAYGLEPGIEYYFKVTAKDEAGNENNGAVASATLPATGPGVALLVLASLGAG
ncbi:MAG: fibronectin type III domain-containing protein, partial [Patescibacteria group bacterium]